ncbi:MAG: hypothetical protein GEU92_02125 [Alphaproteobacteria bacterium]|nr:hypothetical protein [Alphaproteobacteria bacterium]
MRLGWRIASLGHRRRRINGGRIAYALLRPVFSTTPYRWSLGGAPARPAAFNAADSWPGDASRGAIIVAGDFAAAGQVLRGVDSPWRGSGMSNRWRAEAATFDWLRDLRAAGGDVARARGRALIDDWIEHEGWWQPLTWRPHILGARIANWLVHAEFLCAGTSAAFRDRLYASAGLQARHLARIVRMTPPGSARLVALKGLIFAAAGLEGHEARLPRWVRMLEAEIGRQVLGDGGHAERSPAVHLSVLRDLVDMRAVLRDSGAEVPHALQNAIDRMTPMARFFRHGDGGLALFNDSIESEPWLIDVTLTRAEARGKPLDSAPHAGFERLTANRTLVIMDTGCPAPPGFDAHAHAGTLSFEMSVGKERLIVNCGAHAGENESWRTAQRTTAAHSTVTVDDVNSSELLPDGGLGARPEHVAVERREGDGNIWIEATHDGWRRALGVTHTRRLYLGASGGDLRGEDTIDGSGAHRFAVRFHLHPAVKASLVQQGSTVLLRLASGGGWRLRAGGGTISLQESVYLGASGEVRRTGQIVIAGAARDGQGQVKWALSRMTDEK